MATKKPNKPKLKKTPKQPKASASIETWNNYKKRVDQIDAQNKKTMADYHKKLSAYEAEQRKKDSIKNAAAKAKARISGF